MDHTLQQLLQQIINLLRENEFLRNAVKALEAEKAKAKEEVE